MYAQSTPGRALLARRDPEETRAAIETLLTGTPPYEAATRLENLKA